MQREALKFLFDVQRACALISDFISGIDEEQWCANAMVRSAVERQFITIGEALQQAVRVDPALDGRITDFRRIVNFRNVMVHGYARVEPRTVWGVVQQDLPELAAQVSALLQPFLDELDG
ncbi:MAG TPA: DUF86 domain-containing protein [Lacipirellulaceae bacterium]|nr:DUF86 domain-containing protein [Lacipirellulaceae bacterium]HMP07782.1 DUF86 domain-containing protein [Lacipirellulaceae bacterium]